MMPYERVQAWRKAHELVLLVYQASLRWPKAEQYGLVSQARRAAFSVAANISEGAAKKGSREYRRFLDIALGSFSELTYCLKLAADLGYLSPDDEASIESIRVSTGKLLWNLYQAIKRSAERMKP
jgi:four helix bundle protein